MCGGFYNVYNDGERADAYARLEFPGTYYLAFRDLPAIFAEHVAGKRALDFGCGTGRSSRFMRDLGFDVVGVDISRPMLEKARDLDPDGDYRLVSEDSLSGIDESAFDLVLSAFTFDNIPTLEQRRSALVSLKRLLRAGGRIVSVVSSPQMYVNEWASFSTEGLSAEPRRRKRRRCVDSHARRARPPARARCRMHGRGLQDDVRQRRARGAAGAPPSRFGRRTDRVEERDRDCAVGDLRAGHRGMNGR